MKDKLVDILECLGIYEVTANSETIADHLIANGGTVQKKGEWLAKEDYWTMDTIYRCSACKEDFVTIDGETPTENLWRYCPHCGAKMDGDT